MVMQCTAYKLEVRLKNAVEPKPLLALVWVDMEAFSILKFKVFPEAFGGYDYLVRSADRRLENVRIDDIHYFGFKKQRLRFPTRTEITLTYSEKMMRDRGQTMRELKHGSKDPYQMEILTRTKTRFDYRNYRFFKVEVHDPVFKDLNLYN
jgi:hypothetical protein